MSEQHPTPQWYTPSGGTTTAADEAAAAVRQLAEQKLLGERLQGEPAAARAERVRGETCSCDLPVRAVRGPRCNGCGRSVEGCSGPRAGRWSA